MIRISLIFLGIITLLNFQSCSSAEASKTPLSYVANFKISGMVCKHGCKSVIEKEMNKTNGITNFYIDFDKETAEVFFDKNSISIEKIISKVQSINESAYDIELIDAKEQLNARESIEDIIDTKTSV